MSRPLSGGYIKIEYAHSVKDWSILNTVCVFDCVEKSVFIISR
jgi:hypothetical protein